MRMDTAFLLPRAQALSNAAATSESLAKGRARPIAARSFDAIASIKAIAGARGVAGLFVEGDSFNWWPDAEVDFPGSRKGSTEVTVAAAEAAPANWSSG